MARGRREAEKRQKEEVAIATGCVHRGSVYFHLAAGKAPWSRHQESTVGRVSHHRGLLSIRHTFCNTEVSWPK